MPDLQSAQPASLFSSPEFLDVVAQVYYPGQAARPRDYAVGGQTFRLLTLDGRGPVLNQTFIDMHEPLPAASGQAALPSLRRLEGVAHAPVAASVFLAAPDAHQRVGAPAVDWSGFASWDAFLAPLEQRRFFNEDRRRNRRLEALVGVTEYRDDDTAADVLSTCMAWKSARDQEAQRPDLFAVEANRQFFAELRARGLLRASTLRADGRLLAIWLGAVHRQRWNGWIFAFNPDERLRKFSLGRQLLYPMLESSFRAGHREFDFSIGMAAYKLDFATHVRPIGAVGAMPPRERLASAGRSLLQRHPWWAARARAVKGWLHAVHG